MERLEDRRLLASLPWGASSQDTAEYMLGDVLVTLVLMESNGAIDASTENWNPLVRDQNGDVVFDENGRTISANGPNRIEQVKDKVRDGMQWWEDTLHNLSTWWYGNLPNPPEIAHSLDFQFDFSFAHNPVATKYEPIARRSDDHTLWIEEFLIQVGHSTFSPLEYDIREFNNAQRKKFDTDWAFTIFVVDDLNDSDKRFDLRGQFHQAFAFPGGQFLVSPASRPDSTFSHETGHIFWARDEYQSSGASYTDRRGYYDAQNSNAWDNPSGTQDDSIMDAFERLQRAFDAKVSSRSSLEMIGWRDVDADGVFDVLDVPLKLSGTGYYDPASGNYRFLGKSSTQTLANSNSSGLQNDITLNKISRVEYRLAGGSWQTAAQPDSYTADLDLSIPLAAGQQIEIRAVSVDRIPDGSGGTKESLITASPIFRGDTTTRDMVLVQGINGYAFEDKDESGTWNPGEPGLPGWTVQLIDTQGQPLDLQQRLEPDDYQVGDLVNQAIPNTTLTAIGFGVKDGRVGVGNYGSASTGQQVFSHVRPGSLGDDLWSGDWTESSRQLRIDFDQPVIAIALDAVGRTRDGYGRLEIYDAQNRLLGRYTTGILSNGQFETMRLLRETPDIKYAIASAHMSTSVRLDHLRIGPETATVTDATGSYAIPSLPAGQYRVKVTPTSAWKVTSPPSGAQDVLLSDGESVGQVVFGGELAGNGPPWQNPHNPMDVNNDTFVTPRDALNIINDLNTSGSRELPPPGNGQPPPYLDVNGDGFVSPIDVLIIINYLNNKGNGEGGGQRGSGGGGQSGPGEGEWAELLQAMPSARVADPLHLPPAEAADSRRVPSAATRVTDPLQLPSAVGPIATISTTPTPAAGKNNPDTPSAPVVSMTGQDELITQVGIDRRATAWGFGVVRDRLLVPDWHRDRTAAVDQALVDLLDLDDDHHVV